MFFEIHCCALVNNKQNQKVEAWNKQENTKNNAKNDAVVHISSEENATYECVDIYNVICNQCPVRVIWTAKNIVVEDYRSDGYEYKKEYRNTNLSLVLRDSLKTFWIYCLLFHGLILQQLYTHIW